MIFGRFVCGGILGFGVAFVLTGCGGDNSEDPDDPGCTPSPSPQRSQFVTELPDNPIGGYMKATKEIFDEVDMVKFADVDIVYYSYLTLDPSPDDKNPQNKTWGGGMFIEPKTKAPIDQVMGSTDCGSSFHDQQKRIQQVMDTCVTSQKLFIWSIGGWSDLTWTLKEKQIDAFVDKVAVLLSYGGDGVDLAFQHLSTKDGDKKDRRQLMGQLLPKLRKKLDDKDMKGAKIVYTGEYNCFQEKGKQTAGTSLVKQDSDGECVETFNAKDPDTDTTVAEADIVDWVNLQFYDAQQIKAITGTHFTKEDFTGVVESAMSVLGGKKSGKKIMVGVKPGLQVTGAVWEGFGVDLEAVSALRDLGAGGMFLYNMNDETPQDQNPATYFPTKYKWQGSLGKNSQYLAPQARNPSTLVV